MIYYNDHFSERFDVLFGKKSSIVAGEEYPLGYFAAEAMELDASIFEELKKLTHQASQEFDMFLTARTVSSAGMAIQELNRAWEVVRQLPLYNKIPYREGRGSSVGGVVRALRSDEQKLDRMLTVGTTENEMLRRWHGMYDRLADDLKRFRYDTDDMLTDYFEELPSRRPEAYAAAYESCMESFREIYMQTEDDEDLAYMNERRLNFPVSISFVVERDKKTGQPFMAERMTFEDLISFLYWICTGAWRLVMCRGCVTTAASGFWRLAHTTRCTVSVWHRERPPAPAARSVPTEKRNRRTARTLPAVNTQKRMAD